MTARIITYRRAEWAIGSFAPYNRPGMDMIFPAFCKRVGRSLFRAYLATGYVPALWRQAKVVFILKPARSFYLDRGTSDPSVSHRSYGRLERLVDRFLRDEIVALLLLNPNQHAYLAGESVETALHQLVVRFEKALDQQEIALAVFLDLEWVFDNTSYDSMCSVLARHGVDQTIVRWIRTTLEGRLVTTALESVSRSVVVSKDSSGGSYRPNYGALLGMNC